jgi:hypothetical protein
MTLARILFADCYFNCSLSSHNRRIQSEDKVVLCCKEETFVVPSTGFRGFSVPLPDRQGLVYIRQTCLHCCKGHLHRVLSFWANRHADSGEILARNIPFEQDTRKTAKENGEDILSGQLTPWAS